MATTEIEKLERRYAENPQGLTFAPLAEVHRKIGDIPRALELLKSGLELHPNYIPASIVLGRCHWDQGDLPAAEAAFSHVLRLDDENVIALKSLADISERLGRSSEAQRWLKRLISIDRSNEEAQQHLARLEGTRAESAPETAAPALSPAETAPEEPAPVDLAVNVPSSSPDLELLDTSEPPRAAEPPREQASTPQEAGSALREEISRPEEPASVDGLISQEFVPPKEGGYRLHPELTQEVGASAYAPEQLEVETASEVELESSGAGEFRVPNAAEDFLELPPAPPPVVPSAPAAAPPPAQPSRRSYSVLETRGQSVAAFFKAMLGARPPGSPTLAQQDGQADGGAPVAPREQEPRPAGDSKRVAEPVQPVPAAGSSQDASVSFDDFFGAPAGGSAGSKGGSDAGEDDLDQFQSWLQNLKR